MSNQRTTTNIKQIIRNKQERAKAVYIYAKGIGYYLYNGCKVKPEHFDLMLPIEPIINVTPTN